MRSDLHIARDLFESLLGEQAKFKVTGPELEIYDQKGVAFHSVDYDVWDGIHWLPFITLAINCENASLIEISGTRWTTINLSQPESSQQIEDTLAREIADLYCKRKLTDHGTASQSTLPEMRNAPSLPSHPSPKTSTKNNLMGLYKSFLRPES